MTETSPVSISTSIDDNVDDRCNTVGRPMPHLHVKIVAVEDSTLKPLPIGAVGEIVVKGYSVMMGYWQNEAKTKVMQKQSHFFRS